jgi:hypothetical protein
MVAGSLVGDKQRWSVFFKEWRMALDADPAIKHYHGKDLKGLKGPFAQFRDRSKWITEQDGWDAAYRKRDKLRGVIDTSSLIGFGVGVNIPEYNRIRDTHPRAKFFLPKDAFVFVLQSLIYELAKTVQEKINPKARVAFISDDSNRANEYSRIYRDWKRWNPNTAKAMLEISHLDDTKYYGLQAADLAATTVKEVYEQHWKAGKIKEQFPLHSRFWRIANVDEQYMLNVLDNQTLREPEEKAAKVPDVV